METTKQISKIFVPKAFTLKARNEDNDLVSMRFSMRNFCWDKNVRRCDCKLLS